MLTQSAALSEQKNEVQNKSQNTTETISISRLSPQSSAAIQSRHYSARTSKYHLVAKQSSNKESKLLT
jgi:hypothetical protein